jgi:hypothetical protein
LKEGKKFSAKLYQGRTVRYSPLEQRRLSLAESRACKAVSLLCQTKERSGLSFQAGSAPKLDQALFQGLEHKRLVIAPPHVVFIKNGLWRIEITGKQIKIVKHENVPGQGG